MNSKKIIALAIAVICSLVALFLPAEYYHIQNLSVVEQRVIALFVFAALMWIGEAIPIWTTSVVVIVLMLLSISDSSIIFLRGENIEGMRAFGKLIKAKTIMATFADPIIMLFLGGFFLAIGAGKCGLDRNLARVLFKPFGNKSANVLLGLMFVTAIFSMFMSNTATAAMMFAVMAPVLAPMKDSGKGRIALVLAIPIAANVGGIGTPIGTPPNAIALKYLNDPEGLNLGIGFGQWMLVMTPFVIAIILLAWAILLRIFPFYRKELNISFDGKFEKSPKAYIVYATFIVTVLLWMCDKITGINSNVVAMIPIAVFCATGVITKEDLKQINWDVLWLVAGGFALSVGLKESGLAENMINSIPFGKWPPIETIIGAGLLCYAMSTFISNTATTALLVPVLATVANGMEKAAEMSGGVSPLEAFGGVPTLLIGVALSASFAMALPISTPPNAIAHAVGLTTQKQMASIGLIVGIVGLIFGYMLLFVLGGFKYFY
ncbi:MAG: SLC13/DASS family transporter [Opitutales bacterium]|nr:SLC13/DASS family transporter [Opitutales bacterium]